MSRFIKMESSAAMIDNKLKRKVAPMMESKKILQIMTPTVATNAVFREPDGTEFKHPKNKPL